MDKVGGDILVSICCVTYNHEDFIAQAIDSFLIQKTNFNYEILIHDDASTDGTQKIIREYENKYPQLIKPILRTENIKSKIGGGVNVRFNMSRAQGKFIALCEGDDYWTDPNKLQKQVDFLTANPDFSYCFHAWKVLNQETNVISDIAQTNDRTLTLLFRNFKIEHPEIFGEVKNGDNVLKFLLSKFGKARYLDSITPAIHRHHKGGVWSLTNDEFKYKNRLLTAEKLLQYYPEKRTKNSLVRLILEVKNFDKLNHTQIIPTKLFSYLKSNKVLFWYFRYRLALYKVKLLSLFKK